MSRRKKDAEDRILGVAEGFAVLALVALALAFVVLCGGCANTGSRVVVGEQCALPEVSDAADNFSARIYEDIKGASVWTRKDSEVRVAYRCAYTNSYFGLLHTQSDMQLDVTVTPLAECEGQGQWQEQGQDEGASATSVTSETDAQLTAAEESGASVAPAAKRADQAE